MATRQEQNIVKCAQRLVKKLESGGCMLMNGKFLKPVQVEIERMKSLCKSSDEDNG